MRPLLHDAADAAFNLDSGLLHTVITLWRRPGRMIRDYLAGRTRPYTNPAKYLLICGAVTTLASIVSGFTAAAADQMAAMSPEAAEETALAIAMLHRYFNLVLILGLPLLPVLTWVFFRPNAFTFTEHLVFNTYVFAQQNLLWIPVLPFFVVLEAPLLGALLYLIATTAYYLWASRQFFGFGILSTMLRGMVVTVLFSVLFLVGLSVALNLVLGGGGPS